MKKFFKTLLDLIIEHNQKKADLYIHNYRKWSHP